jgi:hypothetical protein
MAKVGSGTIVTVLTAAALGAVGVLAWQAQAAQQKAEAGRPAASASPGAGRKASQEAAARRARALPAGSGSGRRVVYSLTRHRVWLVDADGAVGRTYEVVPGTVSPGPGTYAVTGRYAADRSSAITGTDGTPIEHDVLFTVVKGVPVGFSAAVDGSMPTPDPAKKTGGIREHAADGSAMWTFATVRTAVVVVP